MRYCFAKRLMAKMESAFPPFPPIPLSKSTTLVMLMLMMLLLLLMMMMKIMGHLLFHLLDFLQERQSVFHEVFSGHILLMMKMRLTMMMRLMKRMIDDDDDETCTFPNRTLFL